MQIIDCVKWILPDNVNKGWKRWNKYLLWFFTPFSVPRIRKKMTYDITYDKQDILNYPLYHDYKTKWIFNSRQIQKYNDIKRDAMTLLRDNGHRSRPWRQTCVHQSVSYVTEQNSLKITENLKKYFKQLRYLEVPEKKHPKN